jgi:hypothetical protein
MSAMQPRIEAVRIAEPSQVTPGDHQRVLEGILGPIDIAEDPLGDREQVVAPSADQVDVCLPIPVPSRLHEVPIQRVAPRRRPVGAPSNTTGWSEGFVVQSTQSRRAGDPAGGILRGQEGSMDLRPYYGWIVLLHVVGAFVFVLAHGVSVFVSYQVRREREVERIRALLDLSGTSLATMYGGLAVLLIAGILGGIVGDWFRMGWIWASLAILVVVAVAMYLLASNYYADVRRAVGLPAYQDRNLPTPPPPATPEALDRLLDTRRPDVVALVGILGLLAILVLMVLKPF